jgi:peroxiredoxin
VLLRKRHKDLQGLEVQVLGVSVDHLPSLKVFDAALSQFPFPLAADWHRGICRQYGVLDEEKQAARRVLMLCDAQGVVRQAVMDFDPARPEDLDALVQAAKGLKQ